MNLIYFNKFSVSFHHCDEFDVFFVPDAVPEYAVLRAADAGSVPPRAVSARKPRIQAGLNSRMGFQIWGSARVALKISTQLIIYRGPILQPILPLTKTGTKTTSFEL
jgi:hypothetical protein